ncbi:MAG: Cell division protein DamX [Sodalis sp.]|uniref:SPOR domain-containing protein n=1 Tax=Sodalis sp. (in: enterobacteria) TaxID=1898979 RepID=UPI003872E53D|nr:MAG: Cell division protein DamX [Sodalis sp.]
MYEFKSESELRPDNSDRRSCQRKGPTALKVLVSRQPLMIGICILALLLLVISIGSALKSSSHTDSSRQSADNNGQRNSSDTTSFSPGTTASVANNSQTNSSPAAANGSDGTSLRQELRGPQVASTPTEAAPVTTPSGQQRVELPGNMAETLTKRRDRVDGVAAQMNGQGPVSTLLTAAATLAPGSRSGTQPHKSVSTAPAKAPADARCEPKRTPTSARTPPASAPSTTEGSAVGTIQSAPVGYYTLQLSSASQPATLNAYARQQQLSHYWVYQTRRNGKLWYVLVNGVYPSLSQAKNALAKLPADVQAKKPWARKIDQVKKDQIIKRS